MEALTNLLLSVIALELAGLLFLTWKKTQAICLPPQHQNGVALENYCLWKPEHGKWRVSEDHCWPGFHCGDPPTRPPGTELVLKPATRIKK